MDFGQAAILITVVVGLVALAKALVWGDTKQRITTGIVIVASLLTTFLVAESAWGNTQIIGGEALGNLDWASKVLIGVLLAGGGSTLWEGFTTLKNIGQNKLTPVQEAALDAGAQRLVSAAMPNQGGSHPELPDTTGLTFEDSTK